APAVLGGSPYSYFRYQHHLAANNALAVFAECATEFQRCCGRHYRAVETYCCDDAELVFVMIGSFASKAKAAIDSLRTAGQAVGLLRPLLLRPFPATELREALTGKQGVAVIDQNLSPGHGGVLYSELAAALYPLDQERPLLLSFIGGLGGRDMAPEEFFEMAAVTRHAVETGTVPPPRLLYTEKELAEMRRLQAVAEQTRERGTP
ncbi:MAG: pyruvate synthase, partial [Desulfuromonadaceae bacterium]